MIEPDVRGAGDRRASRRAPRARTAIRLFCCCLLALMTVACGGDQAGDGNGEAQGRGGGRRGGGPGGFAAAGGPLAGDSGVPVRVAAVSRAPIALYFETNGTLEAEHDVDLVARAGGPIVALEVEEGMRVRKGQRLARIDDSEIRAQLAVSEVRLDEAKKAFDRVQQLHRSQLVSQDALDAARATYEASLGDVERFRIQLAYTEITAPFDGQIVTRYVRLAEYLANGARLFRISDFDPLLCPIQVPERELARLRVGQLAELEVEAWPERRFQARVQRISPVVDAATGTIRVTLEVAAENALRPGMFASVFLEMERRNEALVIPKQALALDSLGDTVFVAAGGVAARRPVTLGFENADQLEVVEGLAAGEAVIVVGQDGLSDGTPIEILDGEAPAAGERLARDGPDAASDSPRAGAPPGGGPPGGGPPGGGAGGRFADVDLDDPAQLERVKGFMRQRGLSEAQIEERLKRIRERRGGGGRDR